MYILLKLIIGCVALCALYALLLLQYKEGLENSEPDTDTPAANPGSITSLFSGTTPATDTPTTNTGSITSLFSGTTPSASAPSASAPSASAPAAATDVALNDTLPPAPIAVLPMDITAEQFYALKHTLNMMKTIYTNPDTDKAFCVSAIDSIGVSAPEITDILSDTNINPSIKMLRIAALVDQHGKLVGKIADVAKLPPYINSCGTYTYSTV
jgi:hypothetical protein